MNPAQAAILTQQPSRKKHDPALEEKMGTVNEVVRRKLEAHAKANKVEAQLALAAAQ